jgi:hypothetical protein
MKWTSVISSLFRRGSASSRRTGGRMTRSLLCGKCRVALIAIARGYLNKPAKEMAAPQRAPEPDSERIRVQAFTLDVIDAITIDAILNWSARLTMLVDFVEEPDAFGGDIVLQTFDGLLEAVGALDVDDAIARLGMELGCDDERGGSDARKAQKFRSGQHGSSLCTGLSA